MSRIEVRRNTVIAWPVGVVALALAAGFLTRGGWGYPISAVLLAIAAGQLRSAWDGRTPLLVVDERGVRIRLGSAWRGLPWEAVDEVEHLPRSAVSWWRDGRLAILPFDEAGEVASLRQPARLHALLALRLYGVPFTVPLGLSTRVVGADGDLMAALMRLVPESVTIVEVDPSLAEQPPNRWLEAGRTLLHRLTYRRGLAVAAVAMVGVMVWSVVNIADPQTPGHPAGSISLDSHTVHDGSVTPGKGKHRKTVRKTVSKPVPVTLTAAGGGAYVTIHDGAGKLVFSDDLAFGQHTTLHVAPPLEIASSDGSVVVSVSGGPVTQLGAMGERAERTFRARSSLAR